jgi:hypothetical protein
MVPILERGISEGYFNKDLHPEIALTGTEILYTSITRSDKYKEFDVSPAVIFNSLVEVFLRGMCTPKGLEEIEKNATSIINQ